MDKTLFAHFMVSYGTPDASGMWKGWDYSSALVSHDPDRITDGRRNIAATYYPVIGPYDMTDPDLVEYHCQLLKMAGIDGGMFDLGLYDDFAVKSMNLYVECFKKYGLKAVVIFEDKARFYWDDTLKDRESTVKAAVKDLNGWLRLFKDVQYTVADGRSLVGFFSYSTMVEGKGMSRLSQSELRDWRLSLPEAERPAVVQYPFDPEFAEVLDGRFEWPVITGKPAPDSDAVLYNDFDREKLIWSDPSGSLVEWTRKYPVNVGGVWPGFDDAGCMGWGVGHRVIPRFDGEVYKLHWNRMIDHGYDLVQIVTWNDWFEGSNVEPAAEFGYGYLEDTRRYAAKWKGVPESEWDLRIPEWIYKLKKSSDSKAVEAAVKADEMLRNGDYGQVAALLEPYLPI